MKKEELLSKQQLLLLGIAKEKGYLRLDHAIRIYSNPESAKQALRKLESLEFIQQDPDIFGRWTLCQK